MNQDVNLLKYLATVDASIGKLYDKLIKELAKIGASISDLDTGKLFSFADYPQVKDRVDKILDKYTDAVETRITDGMKDAIDMSYLANTTFLKDYSKLSDKSIKTQREKAKEAFIRSRSKSKDGLGLSNRVWNYTNQARAEFEAGMSEVLEDGLSAGISAEELGRKVRDKLKYPEMVYKRYHLKKLTKEGKKDIIEWRKKIVDEDGKVRFIKTELDMVGRGVYRSSRKNTLRLAATEINMAYRYADNVRWQSEPFIRGIRIRLSKNHTCNGKPFYDICDELQGDYPKTFMWSGWHPRCYSDDSEVLTSEGWKLFKDVNRNSLILSLNPKTRNVEWVAISKMMSWFNNEPMVRFYNKSLDCLVTKEHEMIYLSKDKGEIKRCTADEYRKGKGGFYRGCKYDAQDKEYIEFSGVKLDFDLYCEFMGYWLSDGSTIRGSQIVIAKQDDDSNKENIVRCIKKLGFKVHTSFSKIEFYFATLCEYLKVFGTANTKYIPSEIKSASKRQIRIFLDAYNSCDGSRKKPHSFINDRGNLFEPKNEELVYFTTSERMAADLGELILKVGHRPSYYLEKRAGKEHAFKNGVYTINYDCYRISECRSVTCTVFYKEYIDYKGYVYDLELERNHIMYIRRNGKCFWGSNCRCSASPILIPQEEMDKIYKLPEDEYQNYRPKDLITEMPDKFKSWFEQNKDKIEASIERGTQPYFIRDNKSIIDNLLNRSSSSYGYPERNRDESDIFVRWIDRRISLLRKSTSINDLHKNIEHGKQTIIDIEKKYNIGLIDYRVDGELDRIIVDSSDLTIYLSKYKAILMPPIANTETDAMFNEASKLVDKYLNPKIESFKNRIGAIKNYRLTNRISDFDMHPGVKRDVNEYSTRFGIHIIKPSSKALSKLNTFNEEDIYNSLSNLPNELLSTLNDVYICDFNNPSDSYWAKKYNMPGFKSFATGGMGTIRLYRNNESSKSFNLSCLITTMQHECGHNIDRIMGGISDSELWRKAMDLDYAYSGLKSITEYGKVHSHEDFAESIMGFCSKIESFKHKFPYRYSIISAILKSVYPM